MTHTIGWRERAASRTRSDSGDDLDPSFVHRLEPLSVLLRILVRMARILAIRCRWCSRHSLHTHPATYAALVPCLRSFRRVAIKAAASAVDHSSSVLVSPQTW